jgi:replicative DNA helicase
MAENTILESPQYERSLVSCVHAGFQTHDAEAQRALFSVEPDAFVVPQARAVWTALRGLYGRSEPIDPMTISAELGRLGLLGTVGGFEGLVDVLAFDEFGHPAPLARQVRELHDRRSMVSLAAKLDRQARALDVDPVSARGELSTALMAISQGSKDYQRRSGAHLIERLIEGKPFRGDRGGDKLFWFPVPAWNEAVECAPGHVFILGAGPKTGKTSLAVDSMVLTAEHGVPVGMISLEMDHNEVEGRFAGRLTGQDNRMFLKASWGHAVAAPALKRADIVNRLHWWCHPSGVQWARVEAEIREMVRVDGVRAIVIDYFTLIAKALPPKGSSSNDAALWGQISMNVKRLAQELGIFILLLSQLKREGQDGEPHKNDFRETGQLEQDGNALGFLWGENGKILGKVSDNRSGPSVPPRCLKLDGATCAFADMGPKTSAGSLPSGW